MYLPSYFHMARFSSLVKVDKLKSEAFATRLVVETFLKTDLDDVRAINCRLFQNTVDQISFSEIVQPTHLDFKRALTHLNLFS